MASYRYLLIACFFFSTMNSGFAQNAVAIIEEQLVMPRGAAAQNPIDLSKLALAKIDQGEGGSKLIVLIEQFRTKIQDGPITKFRQEKRTRNVTVKQNGEDVQVQQNYIVTVAYTENGRVSTRVSAGKKPVVIALETTKFFRLDASPVSSDEAKKILGKMRPVFLGRNSKKAIKPASALTQQVVDPDTLVVLTDGIKLP